MEVTLKERKDEILRKMLVTYVKEKFPVLASNWTGIKLYEMSVFHQAFLVAVKCKCTLSTVISVFY